MKILFTHRYIWPDTSPYSAMLQHLCAITANAGHDVHLFGSLPSYRVDAPQAPRRETSDGISITRCFAASEKAAGSVRRVFNALTFCSSLFFHILRLRPDVVTAATFPPVAAGWTASLAAKIVGAQMIYHVQDVHPEVSQFSGGRLGRGLALRLLRWADNQTLRRASAIVVLSDDMAQTLVARNLGDLPIHVINNFSLDTDTAAEDPPDGLKKREGTQRAIFAGNLGTFQNLHVLTEGIAQVLPDHPSLEVLLLGDGAMEAELKARWEDHPQFQFAPFLPFPQAKSLMEDADIGLVSLAPNIFRVSSPSKVETYLDLGLPLLLMVEPDSAIARDVVAHSLGEVPHEPTAQGVAAALRRMLANPSRSQDLAAWKAGAGARARKEVAWLDVIEEMAHPLVTECSDQLEP